MTDNTQPEALRLAKALEYCDASVARQAINELRRQHARIAELEAQLEAIGAGLVEWLAGGSRGISSNTIVQHLTGWPALADWRPDIPHDPEDLDRCLQLLAQVPMLRPLMPRMATCTPMWAALMERWDEIEACHLEEVGLGWAKAKSAPKTYDLMRSVIDAAL